LRPKLDPTQIAGRLLHRYICVDRPAYKSLSARYLSRPRKDLEFLVDQGLLIAPDEVFQEIRVKDDELAKWGKFNKKMFVPLDTDQSLEVSAILEKFPGLVDRNKTIPEADPFLIALAKCRAWTVVTSEKPSNSSVRPKIPNVCKSLNVRWIKLLEFFREIELKYK